MYSYLRCHSNPY